MYVALPLEAQQTLLTRADPFQALTDEYARLGVKGFNPDPVLVNADGQKEHYSTALWDFDEDAILIVVERVIAEKEA